MGVEALLDSRFQSGIGNWDCTEESSGHRKFLVKDLGNWGLKKWSEVRAIQDTSDHISLYQVYSKYNSDASEQQIIQSAVRNLSDPRPTASILHTFIANPNL